MIVPLTFSVVLNVLLCWHFLGLAHIEPPAVPLAAPLQTPLPAVPVARREVRKPVTDITPLSPPLQAANLHLKPLDLFREPSSLDLKDLWDGSSDLCGFPVPNLYLPPQGVHESNRSVMCVSWDHIQDPHTMNLQQAPDGTPLGTQLLKYIVVDVRRVPQHQMVGFVSKLFLNKLDRGGVLVLHHIQNEFPPTVPANVGNCTSPLIKTITSLYATLHFHWWVHPKYGASGPNSYGQESSETLGVHDQIISWLASLNCDRGFCVLRKRGKELVKRSYTRM